MTYTCKTTTRAIVREGRTFTVRETRDGCQRNLTVYVGDPADNAYVGAAWTSRWDNTVSYRAGLFGEGLKARKDGNTDKVFRQCREYLINGTLAHWAAERAEEEARAAGGAA